jgi:molybdate transport system substrate-binding protein
MARRPAAVLLVLLSLLAGCSSDKGGDTDSTATSSTGPVEKPVVFAASSLTETFRDLDIEAEYSFDSSSRLATQVIEGAPADVLATADRPTIQRVVDAGLAQGEPVVFAHNVLSVAVRKADPTRPREPPDLHRPGLRWVLAAPEVPIGRYAVEALAAAGLQVQPVSLEPNVKAVANKIALGEADTGVVYVTDIFADDRLAEVQLFPKKETECWIVALKSGGEAGRRFVDYVLGEDGRERLFRRAFEIPGTEVPR